jgi:methylmalonyl-CoA/ethylmalonyl-CoA epimerase
MKNIDLKSLGASTFSAKGIDHVGFVVRDIRATTRFYVEELGLESIGEPVELEGLNTLVQFIGAGESRIELLMPTSPEGTLFRFLNKHGEGLHHICFSFDDIHGLVERLKIRGVTMIDQQPWRSPHGWAAYIHPESAYGCAVELREHYQ